MYLLEHLRRGSPHPLAEARGALVVTRRTTTAETMEARGGRAGKPGGPPRNWGLGRNPSSLGLWGLYPGGGKF